MKITEEILDYYKNVLKWDPPFAQVLSKYCPDGLSGYLTMREAAQTGPLPAKTRELIFMVLDSVDNEVSGARAHAAAAVEAGMTVEEITQTFVIVTIVKGINVLCMAGVEAIEAAEKKAAELGGKYPTS
ncbi:Carboxymuconolactone decarboxylase family protein [Ruminococcaceae bacterium BL-6]|nr:Carboxymuconolactone decarboxylase family protein [Ruminococcaceae bacterium BL-6]